MFLVLIPILNYISNLCLHLYLVNCLKATFQKTVIFLVHIYHFVLHYTFQVFSCPMRCFVLQGDRVVQLSRRQSLTRWQVSPLCGDTCCCCTLRNVNHTDYKIKSPTPTPCVRHWRYSSGPAYKGSLSLRHTVNCHVFKNSMLIKTEPCIMLWKPQQKYWSVFWWRDEPMDHRNWGFEHKREQPFEWKHSISEFSRTI